MVVLIATGVVVHLLDRSTPSLPCDPGSLQWRRQGDQAIAGCFEPAASADRIAPPSGAAIAAGFKLNLNLAQESELTLVPGIGPSLAKSLVQARRERGPFQSWEEVLRVPGVGPAKFEALRQNAVLGR